jgi:hypothetical protein
MKNYLKNIEFQTVGKNIFLILLGFFQKIPYMGARQIKKWYKFTDKGRTPC